MLLFVARGSCFHYKHIMLSGAADAESSQLHLTRDLNIFLTLLLGKVHDIFVFSKDPFEKSENS